MSISTLSLDVSDIVAGQVRPVSSERARWTQLETWAASVKSSCIVPDGDGVVNLTGNLDVGGNKITSVGTPTANTDGANKAYVDSAVSGASFSTNIAATTLKDDVSVEYSNGYDEWKAITGLSVTITPSTGSHVRVTASVNGSVTGTGDIMLLTIGKSTGGAFSDFEPSQGDQDVSEIETSGILTRYSSNLMIDIIDEDTTADFDGSTPISYCIMVKTNGSGQDGFINRDDQDKVRSISTIVAEELVVA